MDLPASSHLLELGGEWLLWRWFLLRGTGFPVNEVLRLASSDTARAIDRLLALEEAVGAAAVEVATCRQVARRCFDADEIRLDEVVRAIAREDRFREAVTWQNAGAVRTALDPILRAPPGTNNSPMRKHRRLVASYLQRYCAKADTIGFFGPASWADIVAEGEAIRVRPGPTLLAERRVYFEAWAIHALARQLAEREGMRPHLAPRRHPTVRCGSGSCHFEDGRSEPLSADAEHLVAHCDGERSARELIAALALTEDKGLELLGELAARGIVIWTLDLPVNRQYPERALQRALSTIDAPELRDPALAALSELEAGRDEVRRAAGSAVALDAALEAMATTFQRLTGTAATRSAGRTYAGRTLLYEDCTRDLTLALGPALIDRLREPLTLVLDSARWYTHAVAERYRAVFRETYHRLRGASHEVDYRAFFHGVEPYFTGGAMAQPGGGAPLVQGVLEQLAGRWADLLELVPTAREQRFRSADLAPRAKAAFSAPHAGAAHIRYDCPDLMIAAESVEAIARGELHFVLGELHTGLHTFANPLSFDFSADPEPMIRARARDLSPQVEIVPVFGRDRYIRGFPSTYGADAVHFELGDGRSSQSRNQVLAAADLFVQEVGSELLVCHRLTGRTFDVLDFHVVFVNRAHGNQFSIVPPLSHTPRIRIDDLVVSRESWRMKPAEIPFFGVADAFDRLVAARRWTRGLGIPRFVFVKVAEEKKPFYVDFESAIYLELLVHHAKHGSQLTITEMLPDPSQIWLPDRAGNRYVCELRMAVLDGATAGSTAAIRSSQT